MRHAAWCLAPVLLLAAGRASAEPPGPPAPPAPPAPPPKTRLVLNNLLAFRYNPLGFEDQLRAGLQRRLYESSSALFRDNFLFGGIYPKLNPAFAKFGPSIEIQPLSIFNLRLGFELVGFYSTFGLLQSFASPVEEYADSRLLERRKATPAQNYATYGAHATIEPTLQLKFGPIVVRDKLSVEYWKMSVRDGDRVFYDVTLDTLVSRDGWAIQNDVDALYVHDFEGWKGTFQGARFAAGARYTAVKPLYASGDLRPGDARALAANDHHRVGPLLGFTFFDRGYARFNKPTAIVVANWYVHHRYRTGRDVSGAIPYLVVAFSFQSDLLE